MLTRIERMRARFGALRVIDGGLGSELEFRGADVSGPLWSAAVVEQRPELLMAVHRAYLDAGAECLASASYQVSRCGFAELGRSVAEADDALRSAVALACAARDDHAREQAQPSPPLVAASLGPYGAVLHNGAEYHGNYALSFAELTAFHRERIAVMAETAADLVAFETVPSLEEACAIGEALKAWPELPVWISFVCRNGATVAHGEPLRECAARVAAWPQVVAVGVNCLHPRFVAEAIGELRAAGVERVMVYPNLGEGWDAEARQWTGTGESRDYGEQAAEWFRAGAQVVGGCCRTRPEHIARVAQAAR